MHQQSLKLRVIFSAFLLVFLLAAGAATAQAAEGKTFKLAVASDVSSLDPHIQLSEESVAYSHWVFDPLVRWTKDMKIEPRLAERWELINPTTYRFHLRKGVKFHSGNPMTAKDVVFTLNRLKGSTEYKAIFDPFKEAKVVNDYAVDLVTHEPYGLVVSSATYMFIMDSKFYTGNDPATKQPKDFINKTGPSFANTNASGTGPFMVVSREQDIQTTFKAFPEYWGTHGNVETFVFTPIKNDATRIASLLSGDSDMVMGVPTQDFTRLKNDKNIQFESLSSSRVITIQMNQKVSEALRDVRVREALIRGTDNKAIADRIMGGYSTPATQQVPAGMNGHNAALAMRYDPEKAKQLLKEAGFENKLQFSMIAPNNRYVNDERIAQAFVGMMAKIGVKVSLKTMPRTQYWDVFDEQKADLQLIGWHPDTEDAANYSEFLLMCQNTETGAGQYNSGNYCSKALDDLVLATRTETNEAKRNAMLEEIEAIAYKDAAFIPLHFEPYGWAAKKSLKNFSAILNPMNFPYFGDLVIE